MVAGPHTRQRARLTGVGSYAPERVMSNADLEAIMDTSDEWIVSRTGIRERRIAADDQATSDLAIEAVRNLLTSTGTDPSDIDLLVVATTTPDHVLPPTAPLIATALGMVNVAAYDISAACSGFVYGLSQATAMIEAGFAHRVVVVGAETLSRLVNWDDRATCVLFADGAGAVLLESDDGIPGTGVLAFDLGTDGAGHHDLHVAAGGSRLSAMAPGVGPADLGIRMKGREVFRFATRVLVESATRLLDAAGLTVADVDLLLAHQANERILEHASDKLGIARERMVMNLDRYGNTSSASIPLVLDEARATGILEGGALILMVGFGAGLTWGSMLVRWEPRS
ncbi:MAG: ketoacyl-ACP synthase III [Thermoleophilia bacterium]|nr:ketoacyl-ACP synthase III [Thermoleophilia bacterium]